MRLFLYKRQLFYSKSFYKHCIGVVRPLNSEYEYSSIEYIINELSLNIV